MSGRRNRPVKNSKKSCPKLTLQKQLNADEKFIKKLRERKKEYKEFLSQINNFIEYAKDQAKNNDSNELRLKYWDAVNEEESLRDKIKEYIKKNSELIKSIKKF